MKTMHLFAGAGGGLLADLILGHEPIIAVEWEPYACQVLRERASDGWFPDLRVWEGDVRLFDPSEYAGRVDCIHAGFPCTDVSTAGLKAGVGEETRSGLYREVLRICSEVRPKYLFLENVAAITSNGLGTVLGDLAEMGFHARWCCLSAASVGASHKRERWWLLAYTNYMRKPQQEVGECNEWGWSDNSTIESTTIPNTKCSTGESGRSVRRIWWKWKQVPKNTRREITSQPFIRRGIDVVPNRIHSLKCLGNAQVPLQAATAWKLLGGE